VTHPGLGPLTVLGFVLIIGTLERFKCGKQIDSYVGLIFSEDSSAGHKNIGPARLPLGRSPKKRSALELRPLGEG
jgi:Transposase IS116/IS110/IS902 family